MKFANLGIGMSMACAVHCAALPLVTGASCFTGLHVLHAPWVEASLLGSAGLIGYTTLSLSFRRHRRPLPLVLLTLGLICMALAHTLLPEHLSTGTALAGAVLLVAAQVLNHRCPAPCCAHDHCEGETSRAAIGSHSAVRP